MSESASSITTRILLDRGDLLLYRLSIVSDRIEGGTMNRIPFYFHSFLLNKWVPVPEGTGVDRARRHCSVETIRGTGLSEPRWSRPSSKNPLERAWPRWDQRRLSNRREQILHFDLSRKGREAIPTTRVRSARHLLCPYTYHRQTMEGRKEKEKERRTWPMWESRRWCFWKFPLSVLLNRFFDPIKLSAAVISRRRRSAGNIN